MLGTVAVVAHYDPDGRFDPTFRVVLECLGQVCERLVVVTTCRLLPTELPLDSAIEVIQRPNVGYDFYSYRVGIERVIEQGGAERIFLVNSSFLVLDRRHFVDALEEMLQLLGKTQVVGSVESAQWQKHLQSYLMLFRADVLNSSWFQCWVRGIQPRNSKLETIIAGEFGLSKAINDNSADYKVLLNLTWDEKVLASLGWMRFQASKGVSEFVRSLRHVSGFNPVHFAAKPLAKRLGIAKAELLRGNPCSVALDWYERGFATPERELADTFVKTSCKHYRASDQGLSVLAGEAAPLPSMLLVTSAPLARPGVRVAVVLHLFYPELIDEIRGFLRHILEPFDLFVTTPHEGAIVAIFDGFGTLAETVAVALTENRGRDIGPFITLHRQGYLEPYDAVLKIHGKRSKYSEEGDFWRRSLLKELCGTSLVVDKSLELLRHGNAGIVGPHDDYLTNERYWGANRDTVRRLLNASGACVADTPELGFFAGSMFWFKPSALGSLRKIPMLDLTFEPEAGKQDGTLAHALERVFCTVVRSTGYACMSVRLAGCDIGMVATCGNTVPVLPS